MRQDILKQVRVRLDVSRDLLVFLVELLYSTSAEHKCFPSLSHSRLSRGDASKIKSESRGMGKSLSRKRVPQVRVFSRGVFASRVAAPGDAFDNILARDLVPIPRPYREIFFSLSIIHNSHVCD